MSWVKNLLICFGAFWLSWQLVVPASLTIGRIANGVSFSEGFIGAIGWGIVWSVGHTVCAALGAAIVTFVAEAKEPQRWASVVALLYVVAAHPRYHYSQAPTTWDRVAQTVDTVWPAIVCVFIAYLIRRFMRKPTVAASANYAK